VAIAAAIKVFFIISISPEIYGLAVKHCAMANHFNGDLGEITDSPSAETVPSLNLPLITNR
jgi:hypothetical protein